MLERDQACCAALSEVFGSEKFYFLLESWDLKSLAPQLPVGVHRGDIISLEEEIGNPNICPDCPKKLYPEFDLYSDDGDSGNDSNSDEFRGQDT